jgi:hypothetical protein
MRIYIVTLFVEGKGSMCGRFEDQSSAAECAMNVLNGALDHNPNSKVTITSELVPVLPACQTQR